MAVNWGIGRAALRFLLANQPLFSILRRYTIQRQFAQVNSGELVVSKEIGVQFELWSLCGWLCTGWKEECLTSLKSLNLGLVWIGSFKAFGQDNFPNDPLVKLAEVCFQALVSANCAVFVTSACFSELCFRFCKLKESWGMVACCDTYAKIATWDDPALSSQSYFEAIPPVLEATGKVKSLGKMQ